MCANRTSFPAVQTGCDHGCRSLYKHRAFTLRESLMLLILLFIMFILFIPFVSPRRHDARFMHCGTHLRHIHQGWVFWAESHRNHYPVVGQDGTADKCAQKGNSTANIHSLILFNKLYVTEMVVCPSEENPYVQAFIDYDFGGEETALDESDGWDWDFSCDISGKTKSARTGKYYSNVSYAHNPLIGSRFTNEWADTQNSSFPFMSDRGPKDGLSDPLSWSYKQHGKKKVWMGNVVYNDGHVGRHSENRDSDQPFAFYDITWTSTAAAGQPDATPVELLDNFFAEDDPKDGVDIWLAVFGDTTETNAIPIWDPSKKRK